MDFLLHDLFDLPVPNAGSAFIENGTRLRLDLVQTSPALAATLAFHEGWRAVLGVRPTRIDSAAFAMRLASTPKALAALSAPLAPAFSSSDAGAAAMQATLVECTPIRISSLAQKLVERAVDAYRRTLASIASGGTSAVRRMVLEKLADRFGSVVAPVDDGRSIPEIYVSLLKGDPTLESLERWALEPGADYYYVAPKSVAEYYARTGVAAASLRLPDFDPLTGHSVTIAGYDRPGERPPLSAVELLRTPMSRDGFLWRRDTGGTVLVVPPPHFSDGSATTAIRTISESSKFKFRVARIPTALALRALPPAVYRRIAFVDEGALVGALPDHLRSVEIVRIGADRAVDAGRTIVATVDAPPTDKMVQGLYWLPSEPDASFGAHAGHAPSWAEPLRLSMLSAHLLHPCAYAQQTQGAAGELLHHQLVARYASARRLACKVYVTASPGSGGSIGELVAIDSRVNVWSVMSLLVTLDNLRAADWAVTVFCASGNAEFMRSCVLPHVPHARIETLDELEPIDGQAYDIESYNRLLKSSSFWRRLSRSPRALLVQDDGLLLRPGLEDDAELLSQAVVGAPWLDHPDNRKMLQAAGVGPGLVGNGGLSLRDVPAMIDWCDRLSGTLGAKLFNVDMQPVPEDVFFSASAELDGRSCPRGVAERFSFEETLASVSDRPLPLGYHKPWPYVPTAQLSDAFGRYLDEVIKRSGV